MRAQPQPVELPVAAPASKAGAGEAVLAGALAREPEAVRRLVAILTPVIQARVARVLYRQGVLAGREARQEVRDLAQEVFAILFANDARVLRRWDPERGLSLANFVGRVAEQEAKSILRSKRRSPFTDEPVEEATLERGRSEESLERDVGNREMLQLLLARLEQELSPLGRQVFDLVWRQQKPTEQVCAELGLTKDAAHAWRSRIMKRARALRGELEAGERAG